MRTTPSLTDPGVLGWFEEKVARPAGGGSGFWFWTGGITSNGYAAFAVEHDQVHHGHRLALATHLQRHLPVDVWLLHACDETSCVRPAHLRSGTPTANRMDTVARGRLPSSRSTDRREPRGRAVAIREAIGDAPGYDPEVVVSMQAAGDRHVPRLFDLPAPDLAATRALR